MVKGHVAWNHTRVIHEASRDLQRAETQPWFAEYLHPTLEKYFRPDSANHGSYFANWSSTRRPAFSRSRCCNTPP